MFRGSFLIENYRYSLKIFFQYRFSSFLSNKGNIFLGLEGIHCRKIENRKTKGITTQKESVLNFLPPIFGFKASLYSLKILEF